jgi:HEPN domain-containing protein
MKLEPAVEARRWLLQAEQDLDDAEFNLKGRRYNVACFLAQQSAEKALKA